MTAYVNVMAAWYYVRSPPTAVFPKRVCSSDQDRAAVAPGAGKNASQPAKTSYVLKYQCPETAGEFGGMAGLRAGPMLSP
jgi:hypothetical protein